MVQEEQHTTVEIPTFIVDQAHRIASDQRWTLDQAIIYLLNRGLKAQQETELAVSQAYDALAEATPESQEDAEKALIRSVFGPSSVA